MLIVDAQAHIWSQGTPSEQHRQISRDSAEDCLDEGATDEAAHADQPVLLALAKYPNVGVKATGPPGNSSRPYPYRNIHKYIQQIYDAFDPQRMFWSTDISRMSCCGGNA